MREILRNRIDELTGPVLLLVLYVAVLALTESQLKRAVTASERANAPIVEASISAIE